MKSTRISKFYFVFGAVLAVLAFIVAFTFRTVLTSVNASRQIEQADTSEVYINKAKLNELYEEITNKETIPLDL